MSAKWRRNKKRSRWHHIFRDFQMAEDREALQELQDNNSWIRRAYLYRHRLPRAFRGRTWKEFEPLIDVLEEKDEIIVVAGFAGLRRENLKIHVKDQRLSLSAEAYDLKHHKSLNLPKRVIPDAIRTTYKNGVLEIRLKKALEEKISTR